MDYVHAPAPLWGRHPLQGMWGHCTELERAGALEQVGESITDRGTYGSHGSKAELLGSKLHVGSWWSPIVGNWESSFLPYSIIHNLSA